ncbi:MAG: sugar ABC transporter ATP-binding protein [Treponema sp.]|jgi:ribose transport system ATP-binding protein|nr:sugar ABC transporter ATP-binding protein [Treponema sp.]
MSLETTEGPEYRIQMTDICKSFGGVHALESVSLNVKRGEIYALVGENGAGKSTLMKILSGATIPDSGEIRIEGKTVHIHNPKMGIDLGVSVIYQELALMPDMSVTENIFIDRINTGMKIINWKQLHGEAKKILKDLGFEKISPSKKAADFSIAYQQIVEICKALSRNSFILVLDEPTAVLSTVETEQLFKLLKKLRDDGVSIIYISHRLKEIFQICDRGTVLRDGKNAGNVTISEIDEHTLVSMMIGRELQNYFPKRTSHIGEVIFEAKNIVRGTVVNDVSFTVHAGEVFGISGLVGAGRTETLMAILGEDKRDGGSIFIKGKEVGIHSPIDALKAGISLLPEDRKTQGVLLELPIMHNITISCLSKLCRIIGVIDGRRERETADRLIKKLRIKIGNPWDPCSSLSGGNQQKVSISKLLGADCAVLFFDEPTRGVDVGAKVEIYNIINEIVTEGYGVVMVSSEMPEIIGMCDRVAVMRNGRITGVLNKDELTEQNLIKYSMEVV